MNSHYVCKRKHANNFEQLASYFQMLALHCQICSHWNPMMFLSYLGLAHTTREEFENGAFYG